MDTEKKSWNKERVEGEWTSNLGSHKITIEETSIDCEREIEELIEQFKGLLSA